MRLLTHNMLMSPGTKNGFPLGIEVEKMEECETEYSAEFMARMVAKIDYAALLSTLASVMRTLLRVVIMPAPHASAFSARAHACSSGWKFHCQIPCPSNSLTTSHS